MIKDTAAIRMLGMAVAVEQGQTIEGSLMIDCVTGWELAGADVPDCTCEVKHSAGAYVNIETTDISLTPWNGTTQTFDYRIAADASVIDKIRNLPLKVRRAV